MSSSSGNIKQLLRDQLLSASAVTALVENRVFGDHQSDSDAGTVPMPLIIVRVDGGSIGYASDPWTATFELWAYSKQSGDEADSVYDAAFTALQGEQMTSTASITRGVARELPGGRPVGGFNDKLRAWYRRGRWVINGAG
jgi:hypothetical protein